MEIIEPNLGPAIVASSRFFRRRSLRATDFLFAGIILLLTTQLSAIALVFVGGHHKGAFAGFWLGTAITTSGIAALTVWLRRLIARESDRAEAIAEYLSDALFFVEGVDVTYANPLARRLLRIEETPSRPGPEIAALFDQARGVNTPILYDTTVDGRPRHFLVSKARLPRKNATKLEREMFVFQDVTFMRENEEAKVNFIGALSHEIKTPITSLAMALAMLERTGFDPELVRIANADVGRLRILLEDLLNVSKLKIVRNPGSLHKRDTSLTALVHQAMRTAEKQAAAKEVRLLNRTSLRGQLMANIDATRITWVISTLLTDAIRQTPPGGVVSFSLGFDGSMACFEVLYLRRLDSLGPTGHAIVRDIVEAHAGRFISLHLANLESLFRFSIHAHIKGIQKGDTKHEANFAG